MLTKRQEEIINLKIKGKANKTIAYELGISEHTVKVQMYKLCDKYDCYNSVELCCKLIINGVINAKT